MSEGVTPSVIGHVADWSAYNLYKSYIPAKSARRALDSIAALSASGPSATFIMTFKIVSTTQDVKRGNEDLADMVRQRRELPHVHMCAVLIAVAPSAPICDGGET